MILTMRLQSDCVMPSISLNEGPMLVGTKFRLVLIKDYFLLRARVWCAVIWCGARDVIQQLCERRQRIMRRYQYFWLLLGLMTIVQGTGQGQTNEATTAYRVFTSEGKPVNLMDITAQWNEYAVVCLGEKHNDPAAHEVEAELFKLATARYAGGKRPLALSLEMFERDVQVVVDEYLNDLISERHFLASSRPWNNYATDYRPLVETARASKVPVLAANAPGRYVNMVSRLGRDSLARLTPAARGWLPPLPYPAASAAYASKFNALMGLGVPTTTTVPQMGGATHGSSGLLDAQTLRDAAMAEAIAGYLKQNSRGFVFHVNGSFHSEEKLGVPEQLQHYRKGVKTLVVTVTPSDSFPNFTPELGKLGDFVIISDPKRPRSF